MDVNDYVFSIENGIGMITDVFLDTFTVLYENGKEVKENFYDLTKISDNVINIIRNGIFYAAVRRALYLAGMNNVPKSNAVV